LPAETLTILDEVKDSGPLSPALVSPVNASRFADFVSALLDTISTRPVDVPDPDMIPTSPPDPTRAFPEIKSTDPDPWPAVTLTVFVALADAAPDKILMPLLCTLPAADMISRPPLPAALVALLTATLPLEPVLRSDD
jgi:hypothetical protein